MANDIILESTLTCPECGEQTTETMPTDACQWFYECTKCGVLLKPLKGDCCVFCSYGSIHCPPIQQNTATCCSRQTTELKHDQDEWENRYQQGQTGWDRGEASPNLHYWLDNDLLKPCRILIPGCGNGHEVVALAEKGFDVVAVDIAPSPIENLNEVLEAKNLTATLIQADFFTWQPDQHFDAIYEQTSLCALPSEHWQTYETCLYNWLNPKGKLFAHFMQTGQEGGPPFHCEHTAMTNLFASNRWHWSEQHKTNVIHSNGLFEQPYLLKKKV